MPEISEVRLTSDWVTRKNKNRVIEEVEYLPSNKLKMIEEIDVIGSTLSSKLQRTFWFDKKWIE